MYNVLYRIYNVKQLKGMVKMNKEISFTNVMVGASIIGDFSNYLYDILSDKAKFEICLFLFHKHKEQLPKTEEEMFSDVEIAQHYEKLKNYFRNMFENACKREVVNAEEQEAREQRQLAYEKRQKTMEAQKNFKCMNGVAPEGTVSELAEKYGLSKSQIRAMKRDGKLHELMEK